MTPDEAVDDIRRKQEQLLAGAEKATQRAAFGFETDVKANASGRPGPRAPTGNYRRTINTQRTTKTKLRPSASVGSNAPQGQRLENGFVGVDSLGRNYDQPPYPHFGPAVPGAFERLGAYLNSIFD